MKKVKMIITAVAIFAVVGGALAFKTSNRNGTLLCRTTAGACPVDHLYTINSSGATMFCNANGGFNCNVQKSVVQDDN